MNRGFVCSIFITLTALLSAACAGDENPIKPKADVDLVALKAELINNHGFQQGVDMDEWYQLVSDICSNTDSELRMYVAVSVDKRSSVAPMRTGMEYVCPTQAERIDKALESVQQTGQEADLACSLPEYQRTKDQQQFAEAMGCA